MWLKRQLQNAIENPDGNYIYIIVGPRQCGKSSLLSHLGKDQFEEVTLDDFQMRSLANSDPGLFLNSRATPLVIDEAQYAPDLFPELKQIIDQHKKKALHSNTRKKITPIYYLTGSNQILMDKQVKETLVGRASYFYLNTLSVSEILGTLPDTTINQILFQGGWPELYTNKQLNCVNYLNDYIRNYIEKDIVLSAGINKQLEFHTVLKMLASRTGGLLNYSSIAKDSGIKSVTVKEWCSLLERSQLIQLLHPYATNKNVTLKKAPKIYFLDTGIAARLQGWSDLNTFANNPQIGHLFESLVMAEINKFINNHKKSWQVSLWRTKSDEEVDFLIEIDNGKVIAIDAKMAIHGAHPIGIPPALARTIPSIKQITLVTFGGKQQLLSKQCLQVPLANLSDWLSKLQE